MGGERIALRADREQAPDRNRRNRPIADIPPLPLLPATSAGSYRQTFAASQCLTTSITRTSIDASNAPSPNRAAISAATASVASSGASAPITSMSAAYRRSLA
jgi:hypothetical protein